MTRPIQQHLLQLQLSLDACQVDAPRTTRACKTAEIKHYEQQQQQQQQQQQRDKWHQQSSGGDGGGAARRNVYRTNSRRRCDLTPAVRRCVVTDHKTADVTHRTDDVTTTTDNIGDVTQPAQQQPMTLFSRRYVINLDPLTTPRGAPVEQVRPGHRDDVRPGQPGYRGHGGPGHRDMEPGHC